MLCHWLYRSWLRKLAVKWWLVSFRSSVLDILSCSLPGLVLKYPKWRKSHPSRGPKDNVGLRHGSHRWENQVVVPLSKRLYSFWIGGPLTRQRHLWGSVTERPFWASSLQWALFRAHLLVTAGVTIDSCHPRPTSVSSKAVDFKVSLLFRCSRSLWTNMRICPGKSNRQPAPAANSAVFLHSLPQTNLISKHGNHQKDSFKITYPFLAARLFCCLHWG